MSLENPFTGNLLSFDMLSEKKWKEMKRGKKENVEYGMWNMEYLQIDMPGPP